MTTSSLFTLTDLDHALRSAWAEMESFLAGLTGPDLLAEDASGWTIKDHLTHLASWEDSVTILFQGRPRHEGLGVAPEVYAEASFDELNALIMQAQRQRTFAEAFAGLRRSHEALMQGIRSLADADLNQMVADHDPQSSPDDDRRVIDLIYENSAGHFAEHLEWMRAMLARDRDTQRLEEHEDGTRV